MRTIALMTAAVVGLCATETRAASRIERYNCSPSSRVIYTGRTYSQSYNSASMFNFTPQYSNPYASQIQAQANLIRAQADYQLQSAQAALAYQQSRSLALHNRELQIAQQAELQTAWKTRQTEKLAKNKISPEMLAQIARDRATQPLTAAQFNSTTGKLAWPTMLQQPEFEAQRREVEQLVKAGAAPETIREATQELSSTVREHIKLASANDYVAARKFLDQLSVTSLEVTPTTLVAQH